MLHFKYKCIMRRGMVWQRHNAKVPYDFVTVKFSDKIGQTWVDVMTDDDLYNDKSLLNRRALEFSPVNNIYIFQCMGKIFCVEIPHKISYPYIERYYFYTTMKF